MSQNTTHCKSRGSCNSQPYCCPLDWRLSFPDASKEVKPLILLDILLKQRIPAENEGVAQVSGSCGHDARGRYLLSFLLLSVTFPLGFGLHGQEPVVPPRSSV